MEFSQEIQESLEAGRISARDCDLEGVNLAYWNVFSVLGSQNAEAAFFISPREIINYLEKYDYEEAMVFFRGMCKNFIPALQAMPDDIREDMCSSMINFLVTSLKMMDLGLAEGAQKDKIGTVKTDRIVASLLEGIKPLGDDVMREFAYSNMATRLWKETIKRRHSFSSFRHFKDKNKRTWYDEMIENIQLNDASYMAPTFKQAGWLMIGADAQEAAKIKPGE